MPRYFFDTYDGTRTCFDDDGTDLADHEAAREEAVGLLAVIAAERPSQAPRRELSVWVRDEHEQFVLRVVMSVTVDDGVAMRYAA